MHPPQNPFVTFAHNFPGFETLSYSERAEPRQAAAPCPAIGWEAWLDFIRESFANRKPAGILHYKTSMYQYCFYMWSSSSNKMRNITAKVNTHHKAIAVLNHDLSDASVTFEESLHIAITSIVWQTTNINTCNRHLALPLKHVNEKLYPARQCQHVVIYRVSMYVSIYGWKCMDEKKIPRHQHMQNGGSGLCIMKSTEA